MIGLTLPNCVVAMKHGSEHCRPQPPIKQLCNGWRITGNFISHPGWLDLLPCMWGTWWQLGSCTIGLIVCQHCWIEWICQYKWTSVKMPLNTSAWAQVCASPHNKFQLDVRKHSALNQRTETGLLTMLQTPQSNPKPSKKPAPPLKHSPTKQETTKQSY